MQENKMGTQPIRKVMLGMGIPIILSMVLQACYNIVDSMFVANMADYDGIVHAGELAVNALTLAFPVQMLIVAFSIGTGVGVNALLSRQLGERKKEAVGRTAGNGIMLGIIIYAVFVVFALFGINIYLRTQTHNATILKMGNTYLSICTFLCFGNVLYGVFEKLLQATGKTVFSTIAQISGALTNIVLDPIMIYGLFGFPKMNIAGAAWATVIGQIVSLVIAMIFQFGLNKEIPSGFRYLKLEKRTVVRIYRVGIPAIIMQALMSFMTYGVNIIFATVSTAAVTAYGIFYKIQQFILFAAFGLRDAITPLVAYNLGRESKKRVKECIRYGLLYTVIIMLLGTIVAEFFADPLAAVFGLSSTTQILCVRALRIIGLSFPLVGISVALQGVYQGIDSGIHSLIVSLLRLLIIPLPLAYIFAHMANADHLIWWAFDIAEIIAALAAIILLKQDMKNKINQI